MNLADVMDEIAARLDTIDGLRAYAYPADSVQPPAALVDYPEVEFDSTMVRGMDRMTLPVHVLVGLVSDRASRDALAPYTDGTGPSSIKATIEADVAAYTAFHTVRVTGWAPAVMLVADVRYAAATFSLDIAGGN